MRLLRFSVRLLKIEIFTQNRVISEVAITALSQKTSWECLNVGTVPTYKIHNIGTVPMFKMHKIGTPKIYELCLVLDIWIAWQN